MDDGLEEACQISTRSADSDNTVRRYIPPRHPVLSNLPEAFECCSIIAQCESSITSDTPFDEKPENSFEKTLLDKFDALRQDVSGLKQRLNREDGKSFGSMVSFAYAGWKKQFRRAPRSGMKRLEWTCECGEELFADLPIANVGQYQQMLAFLTRPASTTRPAGHSSPIPSDLESGLTSSNDSSPRTSPNSTAGGKAPASTLGSGSTYIGSNSAQSFTWQQGDPYARTKYLELCVNVGKYETKLGEIQVTSSTSTGSTICTDAHLFRKIHDRYFALRKKTWRRLLYRPVGIKFVHFGVQAGHLVSFFSGTPLPSEEVLAAKCYEYNLQPPVPPPIDSRTFLHYFWKHGAHSHSTSALYVDRLPKKLGESLVRSLGVDELREGWGIHILEGPNKVAICWVLLAALAASFGVSLGYNLVVKAGDGGFAIGQWMVGVLAVSVSMLWFGLEDEVDSRFD
ncbi:hypothetical protein K458DRAFT_374542 [Lentithecium fluviatile CBS 122367]|uniref:Uncharacterized protein n=1 Tax=Lentithecium fluviatile CBS 122367 TaxID=1168545 RepID=A0A6G1INB0_9PLEO|nr:hypothetical protein K458DRAFT_374542 [Lentithecium fluviatile CBS 122367]